MYKKPFSLLLIIFLWLAVPYVVFAEEEAAVTAQGWDEGLVSLKANMQKILQENDSLAAENETLRRKMVTMQEELSRLNQEQQKLSQEPLKLQDLLKQKTEATTAQENRLQEARGKLAELASQKKSLEDGLSQKEKNIQSLTKEVEGLKNQIPSLKKEVQSFEGKNKEAMAKQESEKTLLIRQIQDAQLKQAKAEADLEQLKSRAALPSKKIDELTQEQNRLKEELARVKEEKAKSLQEKARAGEEKSQMAGEAKKNLEEAKAAAAKLKEQNEELRKSLKESQNQKPSPKPKSQIPSLEAENKSLKDQVSSLQTTVDNLKQQKGTNESLLNLQSEVIKDRTAKESGSHEMLGFKYAAGGEYTKAITEYQTALKENPSHTKDIYYNLGFIYAKTNELEQARLSFEQVLILDANDKEAHRQISQIYQKLSDPEKSKYHNDQYLQLKGQ